MSEINRAPVSQLTAKQLDLIRSTRESPEQMVSNQAEFDGWARRLWNTPFESALLDTHRAASLLGLPGDRQLSDQLLDEASVLRGMDSNRLAIWRESMSRRLAAMGYDLFDAEAPVTGGIVLPSLAKYFKDKYSALDAKARGEAIYQDLWLEATKALGIHEIGHSLGLRHQFSSSWDSLNYFPQYWQLRTGETAAQVRLAGDLRARAAAVDHQSDQAVLAVRVVHHGGHVHPPVRGRQVRVQRGALRGRRRGDHL